MGKPSKLVRGVSRELRALAQDLRLDPTPAERQLWEALRKRRLAGLRFRQQHPLGTFVFDFYCPAARLIVEVDGGVHDSQRGRDAQRDAHLLRHWYETLRFRNEDVLDRLPYVLDRVTTAAFAINPDAGCRIVPPEDVEEAPL